MAKPDDISIPRWHACLLCTVAVILCFAYAAFRSELPSWWNQSGGGVPYVMFWAFLWTIAFPRNRCIAPICIGVTLLTCLLEVLQLWQPAFLVEFKDSKFGAALLGKQFVWSDIPPYFIGMLLSYAILTATMRFCGRKPKKNKETDSTRVV